MEEVALRSCIAYRGSIKPQDNSGLNQNNLKRRGTNVGVKPKFRHLYISTLKVKEQITTPVLHKNHQKKSSQMMFPEINDQA